MITVHGRTRCQFYKGAADWAAICAVREVVSIPLVANGDLTSVDDLATMLEVSGADAVMIGRGAYGRPWFPGHVAAYAATGVAPAAPRGRALHDLVLAHYEAILAHAGERVGVRAARKHLGWYLETAGVGQRLRGAIMTTENPAAVIRLVSAAFGSDSEEAAA
jgi:tRNA-dihydrouridine synthase